MRKEVKTLLRQVFMYNLFLFVFLASGDTLALFLSFGILLLIITSILKIKNIFITSKAYNSLPIPILVVQGLILVYTYLFRSATLEDPGYRVLFYFFVACFIVMIYVYTYNYRKNCIKEYYE